VISGSIGASTACAVIDLAAYRRNVARIIALVAPATVMAVVKADGYGHGLIQCARAARAAGAGWIGVATPREALVLRAAGDTGPLAAWLYGTDDDLTEPIAAGISVTASSLDHLNRLVAAAATTEQVAGVQLKIDTGLSRNGATVEEWPDLCAAAVEAEVSGAVVIEGVWSHFAAADEPGHRSIAVQQRRFAAAVGVARAAGLRPTWLHLANSAGALTLPEARHDLVRVGIAAYGIDPAPGIAALAGIELEPVMTLRAQLAAVKPLAAGESVSYGQTWTTDRRTRVGLVPLGYGDGIPRHASSGVGPGQAEVAVHTGSLITSRAPVRGVVCMDQFVVELGPDSAAEVGDEVTVFGPAPGPTAQDWAAACGTIGYEIVTRIGARVPRVYVNAEPEPADG
jgi:alanine racemase